MTHIIILTTWAAQRPTPEATQDAPGQPNRENAREGTGKRRYPLFFVADFSPVLTSTSRHRQPGERHHQRRRR